MGYQRLQATWTLSCTGNLIDLSENRITSLPNTTSTSHSSCGTGVVIRCGWGWLPARSLKEKYRARKGDSADIKVGLKCAEEHEWLTYDLTKDTWYLTELGHENA
jgi:hypothetical protein